ncbi:hypothetical protein [Nonomuraea sp. NPDC049400]|uniref:hypothetical protein n=1 Tax=Nonomuraea sp. NPDC049400 TaxID=3364352 RepID=UPI00378CC8B7
MERPTIAGRTLKFVVLAAITLAVLYPFGLAVGTSLMSRAESIANGGSYVLWPSHPTFEAYELILSGGAVTRSVLISIGITVTGTALSLICTVFLGYALSRRGMLGGRPILLMVLATFLFTPGMIPSYLMVKELGMIDTYQSLIVPFAATPSSRPVYNAGLGSVGFTSISKKVDPKRIETLLGVLNYMAAPFGTEEYQLVNFGVEGTHFTKKDGDLSLTDKGRAEVPTTLQPISFVIGSPSALFLPGQPEQTKLIHDFETKVAPMLQQRVTTGHFSDTYTQKNGELSTMGSDMVVDIVTGRKPLSDWPAFVKKWLSRGGEAMRAEYEASIAKG